MKKDIETWMCPADFHWKFVDKKTLSILHKVARDIKPDVLCSLGDEVDYDGIGKFTLKNYGDGVDDCEEELNSFKKGWNELVKSCGSPEQIMCLGSGFPKSHDISKAIDKHLGAKREVIGKAKGAGSVGKNSSNNDTFVTKNQYEDGTHDITAPSTEDAKQW